VLRKTKSILEELDSLFVDKDKENVLESRADHVIQGAINLINTIRESYDSDSTSELERRLLNSIRAQDPKKFIRGIRRIRSESISSNNED
jgi:hypothetical protein